MRSSRLGRGVCPRLSLALLLGMTACSGGGGGDITPPVPLVVASLTVAPVDTTLSVEDTLRFRIEARTAAGQLVQSAPVTYSTFVPSVATVGSNGRLSADGTGVTSVTATAGGVSTTVTVRVRTKVIVYDIPAPSTYAEVYGVSDAGEVVGAMYGTGIPVPFRTTATAIVPLPVTATNAPGQARAITAQSIVGYSDSRYNRWNRAGVRTDSATFGSLISIGIGLNDAGDLLLEVDQNKGFVRRATGRIDSIPGLRGPGSYFLPTALSSTGAVSGVSFDANGALQPVRWSSGTGTSVLSGLTPNAYPASIASQDRIAGFTGSATPLAFLWSPVEGLRTLGTLGGASSIARGINDLGTVVGGAQKSDGYYSAFTWRIGEGMVDIGTTLSGANIAYAVSPGGQIAGLVYPAANAPPGLALSPNKVVLWVTRRRS